MWYIIDARRRDRNGCVSFYWEVSPKEAAVHKKISFHALGTCRGFLFPFMFIFFIRIPAGSSLKCLQASILWEFFRVAPSNTPKAIEEKKKNRENFKSVITRCYNAMWFEELGQLACLFLFVAATECSCPLLQHLFPRIYICNYRLFFSFIWLQMHFAL